MASRKRADRSPLKDRRHIASVLAEVLICRACGWRIEFLSAGTKTFSDDELLHILKCIFSITRKRQWLNIGALSKKQLGIFRPYIKGICGTVECINPELRKNLCPSKPLAPILRMFRYCDELNLKKSITIILGIGESLKDFELLKRFVARHGISRITFYRLKPQKGTAFEHSKGPESCYFAEWLRKTRDAFPKIEIIVGSWISHLDELHLLLKAGADSITKFPSIKLFGSAHARKIEREAGLAGRRFSGTLTRIPKIPLQGIDSLPKELQAKVKQRLAQYERKMRHS